MTLSDEEANGRPDRRTYRSLPRPTLAGELGGAPTYSEVRRELAKLGDPSLES